MGLEPGRDTHLSKCDFLTVWLLPLQQVKPSWEGPDSLVSIQMATKMSADHIWQLEIVTGFSAATYLPFILSTPVCEPPGRHREGLGRGATLTRPLRALTEK